MSSKRPREGEASQVFSQASEPEGGRTVTVRLSKNRFRNIRKKKLSKKQMIKSRQPLVETKSLVQSEQAGTGGYMIVPPTDFVDMPGVFYNLPLHAYTTMEQGLGEDKMIGQSIFSRYLNAKVQIRFPGGANLISDRHYPMELVAGWIPSPLSLTSNTTPKVDAFTPPLMSSYVTQRIAEYFNARVDKLQFIPKHASNIRITYRKRLVADMNKTNVIPATVTATGNGGYVPDIFETVTWKTNKKVFYEKGGARSSDPADPKHNFFPNYSWIPFLCVYSPMYAGETGDNFVPADRCPRVSYNVAHYFTDS